MTILTGSLDSFSNDQDFRSWLKSIVICIVIGIFISIVMSSLGSRASNWNIITGVS